MKKKFTYKQAAIILGYTYEHVRGLVKNGKLGRKFLTGYKITQDDLDSYKRPKMGPPSGTTGKLPNGKVLQKMKEGAWTTEEIAHIYGVTPDAVFKRIARDDK